MGFKKWQKVTWKSQAGGYAKTKTGFIVEVVAAGALPTLHKTEVGQYKVKPRKHESYVVDIKRGHSVHKTYWPVVSLLKLTKDQPDEANPTPVLGFWQTQSAKREAEASCRLDGETQCEPTPPVNMGPLVVTKVGEPVPMQTVLEVPGVEPATPAPATPVTSPE